jgi:hypothetical protein
MHLKDFRGERIKSLACEIVRGFYTKSMPFGNALRCLAKKQGILCHMESCITKGIMYFFCVFLTKIFIII